MKKAYIFFALIAIICTTSCGKFWGASGTPHQIYILLTGECLRSMELEYYHPESLDHQIDRNRFIFTFSLDMADYIIEDTGWKQDRIIPSEETFNTFRGNKKIVKHAFEDVYEECCAYFSAQGRFSISTIIYDKGISLTADKDFAGFPAGEDLASEIMGIPQNDGFPKDAILAPGWNLAENAGTALNIPLDYLTLLEDVISFSIPMGNHTLTDEKVTFELNIPVKVIMYLNWLNDKVTDPKAPVVYKDEVLHCRFTTNHGLR